MDADPEVDRTRSHGRRVTHVQFPALDRDRGVWSVAEPLGPRRVILGETEALEAVAWMRAWPW